MNLRLVAMMAALLLSACTHVHDAARRRMTQSIVDSAADVPSLADDPVFRAAVKVISTLPRHRFVPRGIRADAYRGRPLPIGWDQTISDPYVVAVMTAAARVGRGSNVLEIGTGSGYQAALLARLGARVSTIEIVPQLARRATRTLAHLGLTGVEVRAGDGFAGWPEKGPFDAILVTAGNPEVPPMLLAQLRPGGRLVMPIGPSIPLEQLLVFRKRHDGSFSTCSLGAATFVPLTGRGQLPERLGLLDRSKRHCYGVSVT